MDNNMRSIEDMMDTLSERSDPKPITEITEEQKSDKDWKSLKHKLRDRKEHTREQSYLSPLVRGHDMGRHSGTGGTGESLSFNKKIRRGKNKKARISRRINRQRLKRAS